MFQQVQHPTAGAYDTIAPPLRLSAFEMRGERPAPALGADGADILGEAGLSDEEVKSILG
jgi:crotonobetainyl-CoA:carnitine CoA-transferase CaiB-like acyl-CoA transferase